MQEELTGHRDLCYSGWHRARSTHAVTFTTDISDLWWDPDESGWGANIIQQDRILFMTFFVYGTNGAARWYVAPATEWTGGFVFTGPLYETTGPYFGAGTFNPSLVGRRQVGSATFTLRFINEGTLSYSVDGVPVTKLLNRQTWAMNDLSGSYIGASIGTYSGSCPGGAGYFEEPAFISITHSRTFFSMTADWPANAVSCTYTGTYEQQGRLGEVEGTMACTNGARGAFAAFDLEASGQAVSGRAETRASACMWQGRIGGLRRGQR